MNPVLKFKRLEPEARMPVWATEGSMGADLFAFILSETGRPSNVILPPRSTQVIPTGLAIEPPGMDGDGMFWTPMILSRSGLALNYSIFVANAPGLIDADYRGEVKILLYNGGMGTQYVKHGDRIAQMVMVRMAWPTIANVEQLSETERGDKGFGSTGK